MNAEFLTRQVVNAVLTMVSHLDEDRVFFSMQVARRLPKSASRIFGAIAQRLPSAATGAAGAWLLGAETRAKELVVAEQDEHPSRLLGEIALNLGMLDAATRIAQAINSGKSLRSRILWTTGDIDEAIDALPGTRRGERLKAERATLSPGWWPTVEEHVVARPAANSLSAKFPSSMHVLTNSLPHTRSGYAYRSHLVLTTLKNAGHTVVAATRPSYPVTIGRLSKAETESVDDIDYLRQVPLLPLPTPTARLNEQAGWIANQAARRNVDLLHTTTHYVNGLVTGAAARAIDLPWVYEVRGVLEETWAAAAGTATERDARRASQRFELMRAKEIEVATNADAVITLGETMREHLVSNGVPANSITLIPNSVSEAVIEADTSRNPAEVRAGLGLSESGTWVGTAASIVGYEGLDDLVDAVIIARAKGTDLRLLIAGDGVALPELRERAGVLGENVIFTGRVSQAEAIEYQLALDAIVVPRKNQPVCRLVTPIKPIEAMGLARPVVISDLPALRELVPEAAGLRVSAEDPNELADLLSELACDDSARKKFGQNGREHVLETRRWKDIGQRYDRVYSQLTEADAR
ncbi:MAG: glycosyltransferase family 4 protein [Brevibacterium sp.]|nr:glycosyltransferase family 4 protein [Brevibacterium sp.]MDN5876479.1 glycosyltransferase family 4 protein [Brevibacterium sp.]MDN6122437.1 glycosyltransferase family 4 protein [Brevibacterium sp.]MDN6189542.1 glycosyltransferase family 4 protein [Brevibacterium sp.]MDN6191874.1 glycosyltransferase family 4 protein [Brevibacterium sp.]